MQRRDDRELLRLYFQIPSLEPMPHFVGNEIEVAREQTRPGWSVCLAELSKERLTLWCSDVAEHNRKALLERATDALKYWADIRFVMHRIADPEMSVHEAKSIARRLTNNISDRALVEAFDPGFYSEYDNTDDYQPLVGAFVDGKIICMAYSYATAGAHQIFVHAAQRSMFAQNDALAAAIVWSLEVVRSGSVPLWCGENTDTARLRLAERAGYRSFARLACLTD